MPPLPHIADVSSVSASAAGLDFVHYFCVNLFDDAVCIQYMQYNDASCPPTSDFFHVDHVQKTVVIKNNGKTAHMHLTYTGNAMQVGIFAHDRFYACVFDRSNRHLQRRYLSESPAAKHVDTDGYLRTLYTDRPAPCVVCECRNATLPRIGFSYAHRDRVGRCISCLDDAAMTVMAHVLPPTIVKAAKKTIKGLRLYFLVVVQTANIAGVLTCRQTRGASVPP